MESRKWELTGPAADLLTRAQVAKYFGIHPKTVDRLVAQGVFPRPQPVGNKPLWSGEDIAAYRQLRGRFIVDPTYTHPKDEDEDIEGQ